MVVTTRIGITRGLLALSLWSASVAVQAQSLIVPPLVTIPAAQVAVVRFGREEPRPIAAAAAKAVMSSAALETRDGPPRRRLSCRDKGLRGLAIGAALGAGYGVFLWQKGVEEPAKMTASTTVGFGLIGYAVGYRLCP